MTYLMRRPAPVKPFNEYGFYRLVEREAAKLWQRPQPKLKPFSPAESSVEAFRFLVRQNDPERLIDWLALRSPEENAFFEEHLHGSE